MDATRAAHEALARTTLLIQRDFFPTLSAEDIATGLLDVEITIVSDAMNAATPAAQTMIVATAIALTQSGAQVRVALPDVDILGAQPPLTSGPPLGDALRDHLRSLPTQLSEVASDGHSDLTIVVGNTRFQSSNANQDGDMLRTTGTGWRAILNRGDNTAQTWVGEQPFGPMLCATAIGAEAFRLAIMKLSSRHKCQPLPGHRLEPAAHFELSLAPFDSTGLGRERVDFVSGGAITNACLFALYRIPGLAIDARVFDDDTVQLSNFNRYPLLKATHAREHKVEMLAQAAPPAWTVRPVAVRLSAETIGNYALARNVAVGADDVSSRWLVQTHAPDWVCVAGTSHFEVLVSEHLPDGPCAGCMHPRDEPDDGPIPTVAFVSLLAGTLQAHRIASRLGGARRADPVVAWPLGLDGPHGIRATGESPRPDCPVGCSASRRLTAAIRL